MSWRDNKSLYLLAYEQALREKEGDLATIPLEFEYLRWKNWCEMLIGGDDIGYDVITLGMCFSMFVYFCAYFRFALISRNLTAQWMESHRGIEAGIEIPETSLPALLPFPALPPVCLDCLLAGYLSFKSEDEILWCMKPLPELLHFVRGVNKTNFSL